MHCERWGQSPEDVRFLAQEASHPRTRERLMAIYEVAQGRSSTQVAWQFGREDETVHRWVRGYNQTGPGALQFRRTGGRPPFARRSPKRSERKSEPLLGRRLNPP